MRSWLPLALAGALLAACGASALAIPSVAGPTGIVMLPTARIAPVDQWQTAIGYRSFHVETASISMYDTQDIDVSLWSFNFLKGISSDVELWVTYTRATDGEDSNIWEFGGKYRFHGKFMPKGGFWNGLDASVGLSIGRWVDGLWVDTSGMYGDTVYFSDTEILRSYFVLTKQLVPTYEGEWEWSPPPHTRVDGTLGLLYLELNPDFGDSSTLLQWFLGVEVLFRNGIAFATEYRSKDSDLEDDPVFSTLLRYPDRPAAQLRVRPDQCFPRRPRPRRAGSFREDHLLGSSRRLLTPPRLNQHVCGQGTASPSPVALRQGLTPCSRSPSPRSGTARAR